MSAFLFLATVASCALFLLALALFAAYTFHVDHEDDLNEE